MRENRMGNLFSWSTKLGPVYEKNKEIATELRSKMRKHFKDSHRTLKEIQTKTLKGDFPQARELYKAYYKQQMLAFKDMASHVTSHMLKATSTLQEEGVKAPSSFEKPTFFSNLSKIAKFNAALMATLISFSLSTNFSQASGPEETELTLTSSRPGKIDDQYMADFLKRFATPKGSKILFEAATSSAKQAIKGAEQKFFRSLEEKEIAINFVKTLGKNLTPELIKNTFEDLYKKLGNIWDKPSLDTETADEVKNITWQQKLADTTMKVAKSYLTLQWGMMKFSWKVGFNMMKEWGPQAISLAFKQLGWILPLVL